MEHFRGFTRSCEKDGLNCKAADQDNSRKIYINDEHNRHLYSYHKGVSDNLGLCFSSSVSVSVSLYFSLSSSLSLSLSLSHSAPLSLNLFPVEAPQSKQSRFALKSLQPEPELNRTNGKCVTCRSRTPRSVKVRMKTMAFPPTYSVLVPSWWYMLM